MKYLIAPALLAMAVATSAAAETRNLTGFDQVNAADRIEVTVAMGPAYAVQVEGPDAARVRTVVDGDTLRITDRNRSWFGGNRRINASVHITMPRIDGLASSRGATLRAENIRATSINLAASMGGDLDVSGTCTTLNASASMGGTLDAENFHCSTANISASMGGEVEAFAAQRFDASASMGGDVEVAGAGERGDVSTTMGGSVTQTTAR